MRDNIQGKESIRMIEMRNCVYQGFLNENGKRSGFGIILDDDMNLYCSQWQNNQMNGYTLCILNNSKYIFGIFKNDKIHGSALYRDDHYSIVSKYNNGAPFGNAVAFPISLSNGVVFQGSELIGKNKRKEVLTANFIKIKQIKEFQELINEVTQNYDINIKKSGCSLLEILNRFFKKYEKYLLFYKKESMYTFGFMSGIRFEFLMDGNVYQKIKIIKRGIFNRSLQFGIKVHEGRCIEQGNFKTKQTITYNNICDRPYQKCRIYYQKIHKKSMCFVNEYFFLKQNVIDVYGQFISKRLEITFQKKVNEEYKKNTYRNLLSEAKEIDDNQVGKEEQKIAIEEKRNTKMQCHGKIDNHLKKNKSLNQINRNLKISPSFEKKKLDYKRTNQQPLTKNRSMIQIKKIEVKDIHYNQQRIKETPQIQSLSKKIYLEDKYQKVKEHKGLNKSPSRLNEQKIRQQLKNYHQSKYCKQIALNRIPLKQNNANDKKVMQKRGKYLGSEISIGEKRYLAEEQMSQIFEQIQNRRMKLMSEFKNLNIEQSKKSQQNSSDFGGRLNASTIKFRQDERDDYLYCDRVRLPKQRQQSLSEITSFNNKYKCLIQQRQVKPFKKISKAQRQNTYEFSS